MLIWKATKTLTLATTLLLLLSIIMLHGNPGKENPALAGEHSRANQTLFSIAEKEANPSATAGAPTKATKEWTFMVYMAADNDLEQAGIDDFNEMEYAGSTAEINIIVQFDRHPDYDTSNGNWTTTRRYYVDTDPYGYDSTIRSTLVEDLGELNMGSAQTLIDFAKWGLDNYPAEKYCLVLWDHGAGLNFVCQDLTNGDQIIMPELKTALKAIKEHLGRPIDILAYDACLMAQVDVYYQTKAYCELQVGSEEVVGADGMPYNTILADLKATPTLTPEQFASTIVTRYSGAYSPTGHATISACNMTNFDYQLAEAVNIFAQKLRHQASTYKAEIRNAWLTAENYSSDYYPQGKHFLDLADFAAKIKSYISDSEIQSAAQEVIDKVALMVIAEWHGSANPGSNGITIYFPETVYPIDALSNHFAIETNWNEFLKSYYDNVNVPNLEPLCQITYPKSDAIFAQPTIVRISGNASDDVKVESAQVKIDRGDWVNATGALEWYWDWNVSNLSLGAHRIWARSLDSTDYSNYKNITVNITSVAKNDTGIKSINYPLNNTTYGPGTITINATVINLGENSQSSFSVSCEIKEFGSNLSSYPYDFDSGAQGWSHNGTYDNWELGSPVVGPPSAHSEPSCWGTNLSGAYLNLQDCNLTSPSLDLSNALTAELTFWMYGDFEDGGAWDGGIVEISPDNGTTWSQLDSENAQAQYDAKIATTYNNPLAGKWAFCYDTTTWIQKKFNITEYVGKVIKFSFRFGSDNGGTAGAGWYIDDVVVLMTIPRPELPVYKNTQSTAVLLAQNDTVNLTWSWDFVNQTDYRIIIRTLLEVDERPHNDGQDIIITIEGFLFTASLQPGWNYIALTGSNATLTNASDLAQAIGDNCTKVANWTATGLVTYTKGALLTDFSLEQGRGYLVCIANGTTKFSVEGTKLASATVTLNKGWSNIGLLNSSLSKASELASAIGDCSAVAYWDNSLGRFVVYNGQISNFELEVGKGYLVFMEVAKKWLQEA